MNDEMINEKANEIGEKAINDFWATVSNELFDRGYSTDDNEKIQNKIGELLKEW